jgi:uncharacterized damage-inducible protein DinB
MITPAHAQLMARYNRWQNQSLYGCAAQLSDAQRQEQRGAFFGSIHGTLSHLLFGDQAWMSRFTGDEAFKPTATSIAASATAIADWADLRQQRVALDDAIIRWADALTPAALDGDLTWRPMSGGNANTRPRWLLVTHMFNHQTHHRGQVHGLLTAFGQKPDVTDIPFMPI